MDNRLYLIDAFALIYRAFFAFGNNHRYNSKGLNTSAAFGFTNTLINLIKEEKPTHLGIVFDSSEPTFRHEMYAPYKAHRQEMPEGLRECLPYIHQIIEAFNIPLIKKPGFEADDIIGTMAHHAAAKGYVVYMVTPDKDYGQLVQENVYMYKPGRQGNEKSILGVEEIKAIWEINDPMQVIDILALWGDASDNIPGIPGIGEKTAKKLIAEYGSVDGLIANADKLKGKQKENVIAFAEQGRLSKILATIELNVPVEFNYEALKIEEPNKEKIAEVFSVLEFRSLTERVLGATESIRNHQSAQLNLFDSSTASSSTSLPASIETNNYLTNKTVDHEYQIVLAQDIAALIQELSKQKSICFDTETDGLDVINCNLVGISFAFEKGKAFYIPLPQEYEETKTLLLKFNALFENEKTEKIAHNAKFDLQVLKRYGITVAGPIYDTMLAHFVLKPEGKQNMDELSRIYLNYEPISITDLIGPKGKDQGNMKDVAIETIAEYAAEDADITLQLKTIFQKEIDKLQLNNLLLQAEFPLIQVLCAMELEGVCIDKHFLNNYSTQLQTDIERLEKTVFEQAGTTFNLASPKQLGEVLFDLLKLDSKAKKTATGQYKTSEDVLQILALEHPIAATVLEYRTLQKLKSTYVDALPNMINPTTGRVHTSYNQALTATGRLSSNNPNLQNIPIRTEQGREIRKAFIPKDENYLILSVDYSQIELRIMAHFSKDDAMTKAFVDGHDIHIATASNVFHVPIEEVTADQRRKAKMVNFGIIYGISAFGLAQRLGIPRSESAELIDAYFKTYPNIKNFMSDIVNTAREQGYVETILGRRRYLPDINSSNFNVKGFAERNAINTPIQGSAADLIKLAMINIHHKLLHEFKHSKMILQVHDELVFEAHKNEIEALKAMVVHEMEHALNLSVPLKADFGVGNNWLEAH